MHPMYLHVCTIDLVNYIFILDASEYWIMWSICEHLGGKQGGSSGSESSPSREALPMEGIIEDIQSRIKRLERWHAINTVLWTFFMSALVGYSLYQRKRQ
eukprot:TRINITY_DN5256_c0_g1_i17.p1 TRINITY_DN5256_c0_g1~~TRINITY_DN5256_c0_g1_i17.p1  ORF type:complete len:100 (-),score=7.01 TRINITY_DN5256_c0_g1_i17:387-686(-)